MASGGAEALEEKVHADSSDGASSRSTSAGRDSDATSQSPTSSREVGASAAGRLWAAMREGANVDPRIKALAGAPPACTDGGGALQLHAFVKAVKVRPWDAGRFAMLGTIQDAARNHGRVLLARDACGRCADGGAGGADEDEGGGAGGARGVLVAVKDMPATWARENHEAFALAYAADVERPWVDMGCLEFLREAEYPYACRLMGVFSGEKRLRVVTELASGGDLISWCADPAAVQPGPEREALVRPLAWQLLDALRWLHDLSIVHRDISWENVVLTRGSSPGGGAYEVKLIDFAQASGVRHVRGRRHGKPSYRAPEMFSGEQYDGFLSDTFAAGVTLYNTLLLSYPWPSTEPEAECKAFAYFRDKGFEAFARRRKLMGSEKKAIDHLSEPALQFLAGLFQVDPSARCTLGEAAWPEDESHRSVWSASWWEHGAAA